MQTLAFPCWSGWGSKWEIFQGQEVGPVFLQSSLKPLWNFLQFNFFEGLAPLTNFPTPLFHSPIPPSPESHWCRFAMGVFGVLYPLSTPVHPYAPLHILVHPWTPHAHSCIPQYTPCKPFETSNQQSFFGPKTIFYTHASKQGVDTFFLRALWNLSQFNFFEGLPCAPLSKQSGVGSGPRNFLFLYKKNFIFLI